MFFATILAAFSLATLVNFTEPESASKLTFAFFYVSLFLFSLGIFSLLGLFIRQKIGTGLYLTNFKHSFRQALSVSVFITSSFILQSFGLLFWWVALSIILFLVFIEIFINLKI